MKMLNKFALAERAENSSKSALRVLFCLYFVLLIVLAEIGLFLDHQSFAKPCNCVVWFKKKTFWVEND